MQGHRGTVSSMPETLNIDHGSTSTNAAIDQQICWTNIISRAEDRFPDLTFSSNGTNVTFMNSVSHEPHNFSKWSLGEASSSGTKNDASHEVLKAEHVCPSSVNVFGGAGPRLDGRQYGPTDILSFDTGNVNPPPFVQDSSFAAIPQNLNGNASYVGPGGDSSQGTEHLNMHKSSGSMNEMVPPSSCSQSNVVEENDDRSDHSFEGRRTFCKRKALDGHVGPSSMDGSYSYLQHPVSSSWPTLPARHDAGSSLSIFASSEQVNSRLGLGVRAVSSDSNPASVIPASAQSSRRNFRMRLNPVNQQESFPPLFSMDRNPGVSTSQQSSRLLPFDHSLDVNTAPMVHNMSTQSQPVVFHPPALPRNVQRFQLGGGSHSRNVSSVVPAEGVPSREEGRSRSMSRNVLEHPMFAPGPELRNLVRSRASRNLAAANTSIPGNVSSTSRTGSDSSLHPSSVPGWAVPQPNSSSHHRRRFSELVRRSLLSTPATDSGGESNNHSPVHQGPSAPVEEMVFSSGSGNQRRHHEFPRSASWMERQGDGLLGIPHALRNLTTASEGRTRLVASEIRNVLDLMRRGERLRIEDVMVLDQSVYFGMADIHDRHRDMRLDVDNMSYEELLALEERIGNVSTGLNEESISNKLKKNKCCVVKGVEQEAEPCCVCQEEYNDGEDVGVLDCGHEFHTECIKRWLMHKNICPICKEIGLSK